MKTIVINTQAELDALPASFSEETVVEIHGGTRYDRIIVRHNFENGHIVGREHCYIEGREHCSIVGWENCSIVGWENCSIVGRENCSIVGRGNCSIVGWENCSIEGWENCSIVGRENCSIVGGGNCSIVGWENCSIEGWENCSIVGRENCSIEGWENCSIVGRENCSIVGGGNSAIHIQSPDCSLELFAFAVAWLIAKCKVTKHGETCQVIEPTVPQGLDGWLEREGVDADKEQVVLFKRVDLFFKTQEGQLSETIWTVGTTVEHGAWNPTLQECGAGKFHACSHPYFCNEFRNQQGDRFIAIKIHKDDLYVWPNADYPHKIAFRKGEVLYECDMMGKKLAVPAGTP
jgi:hypothetical protein